MKIRSITYFCNPGWPLDEKILRLAGDFLAETKASCQQAGFEVQTTRLATVPFPLLFKDMDQVPLAARTLGAALAEIGIAYGAFGPALPNRPESYPIIPDAIAEADNIFFSGLMAETSHGLSLAAARACAEIIVRTAPLGPHGFSNLQFAALANVPPGSPFFPAAYHQGDLPAFAVATEAASLAVDAFTGAGTIADGRAALVASLEAQALELCRVADLMKFKHHVRFGGIDFSLAPFPSQARSLGTAFERMGIPAVGLHGSTAAAAVLTEAIERARFPRAGFSGLMLPVLEDSTLANRAAGGELTIKDLLLYSAVCGTGLDTVPLPGDVSIDQVTALLIDLAALALRLDKPLTARLMPIPGKAAGDVTSFDFDYFANSRVMSLDALPLQGALQGQESFPLQATLRRSNSE